MLFENNSNNVNSKNQNINRVASLESPPPSDIDSNNHSHTAYFDADISTVPKAECQNTLNVLNSTSLALGDRSIPRFVHDTDRAFEIEPASSLSQLCSASTISPPSCVIKHGESSGQPTRAPYSFASLNCWYTNAGSINNKWTDLKANLLHLNHPHLVLLTETLFRDSSLKQLNN